MNAFRRLTLSLSLLLSSAALAPAMAQVASETIQTSAGALQVSAVVTGLDEPWGFGFLPDGKIVVTERDGRVLLVTPGAGAVALRNPPQVLADGQGGLLDVLVPRDFAQSRTLYFTHAKRQGRGSGTAVTKAVLSADGTALTAHDTIFEIAPGSSGGRHFGSRLVEARDGTLFVTVGDRGSDDTAQDRSLHNGSVLRITKTGAVPSDNPFVNTAGVLPEIWSYGHRNPQGAAMDSNGQLWVTEHCARGGDEVKRCEKEPCALCVSSLARGEARGAREAMCRARDLCAKRRRTTEAVGAVISYHRSFKTIYEYRCDMDILSRVCFESSYHGHIL